MKIDQKTAKKLYKDSPEWFQKSLIEAFGKETLIEKKFTDIKTFEDACEILEIDPNSVVSDNDTKDEAAYKKLKIIVRAINEGWVPNWDNNDEKKWWPWFILSSGFGFAYSIYYFTDATVGSRLCFQSREKSNYAAQQFIDLYEIYLK